MPKHKRPDYEVVHLDIPFEQIKRLIRGNEINLKHHQLMTGDPVVLHRTKVRKIERAHARQRGCRIGLTPEEFELQHTHVGGGKFLDALKSAGQWLKKNVIDTDVYQKSIKPIVKQGVNFGVEQVAKAIATKAPFLAPVAQEVIQYGANKVGNATGAFGVRQRHQYGGTLLVDNSMSRGNYSKGSALNPALPPQDFSHPNYALHRVKGSQEAKDHMAKIRAMRRPKGAGVNAPGY